MSNREVRSPNSGMANIAFCDGHAKGLNIEEIAKTRVVSNGGVANQNVFYYFTVADD